MEKDGKVARMGRIGWVTGHWPVYMFKGLKLKSGPILWR